MPLKSMPPFFRNFWLRVFGLGLIFGVSIYASYHFLILPKILEQEILEQKIQRTEGQIKETISQIPDLGDVREKLKEENDQIQVLKRKISDLENQILIAAQLRSILKGLPFNFKEKELTLSGAKPILFLSYAQQSFYVSIQASFPAVMDYLALVEKSSPFLTIHSFRIKQEEGGEALSAELKLSALSLQKSGTEKPSPTPSPTTSVFQNLSDPFVFRQVGSSPRPLDKSKTLHLSQLILRGRDRFAVINNQWLREGQKISEALSIKKITNRQIVLVDKGIERVLTLE